MKALAMGVLLAVAVTLGAGVDWAFAQVAKVNITREESKPKTVEIKVGQEVQFINNTGGIAHVSATKVHAHTGSVSVK